MAVKGSNGAGALDTRLLREEATSITDAVVRIVRVTDQVSQGAETQVRSLDDALSGLNEMTTSLKETASQAESISGSTDGLVSSINEVAASIEQVTANVTGLAGFIQQTATSIQQNNASIQDVAALTQQMSSSADQVATSMVEMTASVKATTADKPPPRRRAPTCVPSRATVSGPSRSARRRCGSRSV